MDEAKRTFFSLAEVFPGLAIALGVVGLQVGVWRFLIKPAIELGMRLESDKGDTNTTSQKAV